MASLCVLGAVGLATAHVQVFYNATERRPVRNAAGPDGTGRMSVSGPCGGNNAWGNNGFQEITAGTPMHVKIQYNGGHRSLRNEFHATYLCNQGGPTQAEMRTAADDMSMMLPLLASTSPMPTSRGAGQPRYFVNASTGNRVQGGYTLGFILPATAMGRCTVSVMDQRYWGGCVDLNVRMPPPTSPPVVGGTGAPSRAPTAPPPPITLSELDDNPYRNTPTSCGDDFPTCCCVYANFTVRAAGSFGGTSWPDYVDADMWTDGQCTWGPFMMPQYMASYRMLPLMRQSLGSFVTQSTVEFPMANSAEAGMLGPGGGEPFRIRVANGTVEYTNEVDTVFFQPTGPGIAFCSGYTSSFTAQVPMLLAAFDDLHAEVEANWQMVMAFQDMSALSQLQMIPQLRASTEALQAQHANFTAMYNSLSPYEKRFVVAGNVSNTTMAFNMTVTTALASIAATSSSNPGGTAGAGGSSEKEGSTDGAVGIAVGFFVLLAIVAALFVFRGRIADVLGVGSGAGAGATKLDNLTIEHESAHDDSETDREAAVVNHSYEPAQERPQRPPPARAPPARMLGEWETLHDEDGTPYYHNTATGATQWEMPVASM